MTARAAQSPLSIDRDMSGPQDRRGQACPATPPRRMCLLPLRVARIAGPLLAVVALLLSASAATAQGRCPGQPLCREVAKFSATITDFRVSPNTVGNRPVSVTLRFTNRTGAALILGYVDKSAAAYDDRGNKHELQGSQALKGIGRVERNRFDPKFMLGPGESADARIELNFFASNVIVGTEFDFEISVREIEALAGNQYRLGREHALSWQHLRDGLRGGASRAAGPLADGAAAAPTSAAAGRAMPAGDPCLGAVNCTASGPVLAKVVGVQSAAPTGNNHQVTVRIAFQNLGAVPLILNYKAGTGEMLDERGEKYIVDSRYRESVQGMPVSTRTSASSQFTLNPGESRVASFIYRRFVGKVPAGRVFSPSIAVEQYELQASNQLKLEREYALGFGEVRGGASLQNLDQVQDLTEAVKGLRELFKTKN